MGLNDYVDLDTVHQPFSGTLVPTSWGHGIANNFDVLWRPPVLVASRSSLPHSGTPAIDELRSMANDEVTDMEWTEIKEHYGDFFNISDISPSVFVVPQTGFYAVHCKAIFDFDGLSNATAKAFVAFVYSDAISTTSDDTTNYLLRSSADISVEHISLGGICRLVAGWNIRFVAYQNSGDRAHLSGSCSIGYLGGQ